MRGGLGGFHILRREAILAFRSPELALQFLQRFKTQPLAMAEFRGVLQGSLHGAEVARASDDQVLQQVALMLCRGDLTIASEWHQHRNELPGEAAKVESASLPSNATRTARTEEPEPDTYEPGHDPGAQAAVLMAAADQGVPFCAVCEAARAAARN